MNSRLKSFAVTFSTILVALLLMGAVVGQNKSGEGAYKQLGVYTEVLGRIKSDYVEEPDLKSVTLGAINGLLESVDPFASYLNADQYKEYQKNKDAYKGTVGLTLSKRFGYVGVVDAIPGSPADKAGLTTGDMVESIQGIATRDMPLAYATLLLAGKPGTSVEISIMAVRRPEPKTITLVRTEVQLPRVSSKMLADQVGYIRAEAMDGRTAAEIAAAVKSLEGQGAKRLILDLRHSSTGVPEQGVAVANLFLERGLITYLQGQRVERQDFLADPAKAITKLPLVVTVNRGTAGGAEIAAAALLDTKRAEVVGERTYDGDASVRKAISMDDGGAIILAVAKYYAPGGKAILDVGVTPSVLMIDSAAQTTPDDDGGAGETPAPSPESEDPILKKAIEVITKGATTAAKAARPVERVAVSSLEC